MWNWIVQHEFAVTVATTYLFLSVVQTLVVNVRSLGPLLNLPGAGTRKLTSARLAGLAALLVVGLASSTVACKSAAYRVHPGAVDVFDSQSYDVLLVAQATLRQAKADAESGALPAAAAAPLNQAIKAYDVADAAWQAYHAAGANPATKNTLQQSLVSLTAALSELQQLTPAKPASSSTTSNGGKQ